VPNINTRKVDVDKSGAPSDHGALKILRGNLPYDSAPEMGNRQATWTGMEWRVWVMWLWLSTYTRHGLKAASSFSSSSA